MAEPGIVDVLGLDVPAMGKLRTDSETQGRGRGASFWTFAKPIHAQVGSWMWK